jgi:hypothetical protein
VQQNWLEINAFEARCGIDVTPADGDGCHNGPAEVKVCGTCGILYDVAYPIIAKN